MPRRVKSRIRKIIESGITTGNIAPQFLDAGVVFIYPSKTDIGSYYLVAKLLDRKSAREYWACSCRGFRFNDLDQCTHVNTVNEQMEELKSGQEVVRQKRGRKKSDNTRGPKGKNAVDSKRTGKKKSTGGNNRKTRS